MIAIISAMQKEITNLLNAFDSYETINYQNQEIYIGKMFGKDTLIARTGIGKINAAMMTTKVLENYDVDVVVNIGVCGGIKPLKSGDIILGEKMYCYDLDLTDIDDVKVGQIEGFPWFYEPTKKELERAKNSFDKINVKYNLVPVLTCDKFVTKYSQLGEMQNLVDMPFGIDMEAYAICQVAYLYNKNVIVIKGVSDTINSENQVIDYSKVVDEICTKTTNIAKEYIKEI